MFSLVKLVFRVRASAIDKLMVISELAVQSARLLGLGSKLYPSKHATHAQQSSYLIEVESFSSGSKSRKQKKGSDGRVLDEVKVKGKA